MKASRDATDQGGAHIAASEVEAEDGDVVVDGPDGVAVTMTPDAAIETSQRLLDAGMTANGQRRTNGHRNDRS